ncbi:hypothetical protein GCM10008986_26590 [Salinibacillus aidingensis]|uniref:Uncharacterized protein n=1 Tax=Salinibacillus aidingensis TaxID=237684 RepID=A0ABN1BI04_9BACI
MDKKRKKDQVKPEIEKVDTEEIKHHTSHPDQSEVNMQDVNFAPGENGYISGGSEGNIYG